AQRLPGDTTRCSTDRARRRGRPATVGTAATGRYAAPARGTGRVHRRPVRTAAPATGRGHPLARCACPGGTGAPSLAAARPGDRGIRGGGGRGAERHGSGQWRPVDARASPGAYVRTGPGQPPRLLRRTGPRDTVVEPGSRRAARSLRRPARGTATVAARPGRRRAEP